MEGALNLSYEVDVIGVGKESKSGDAIALRWGNLHGNRNEQKVVLIDGGFEKSGKDVVNHIKHYYGTELIDLVVSTHPDRDHVNGLHVVLDQMTVKELWIHKPWKDNRGLDEKFLDERITDQSIQSRLQESLNSATKLVEIAKRKKIPIVEPFTDTSLNEQNEFHVLGPTQEYYESLVPLFDGMPKPLAETAGPVGSPMKQPKWGVDALDDQDTTSATNNSSVITALIVEGRCLLFTGDAGITALTYAADKLDLIRSGADLGFMQIPHHGSRQNIGPAILDRLIGKPVEQGENRDICAIASTAVKGEPKHPSKSVMNAFTHRGVSTVATKGFTICYSHNAPIRKNWSLVKPEKYHWTCDSEG